MNDRSLAFVGHFIINTFCPETLQPQSFLRTWSSVVFLLPRVIPYSLSSLVSEFSLSAFNPSITSFPFQQMPPSCPPRFRLISALLVVSYLSFLCLVTLPFLQANTSPRLGWDAGHRQWTTRQIRSDRIYRRVWLNIMLQTPTIVYRYLLNPHL